jgi:hypothetical protein
MSQKSSKSNVSPATLALAKLVNGNRDRQPSLTRSQINATWKRLGLVPWGSRDQKQSITQPEVAKITFYSFPGALDEAQIVGDRSFEDVSCPYCQSSGSCVHLLACIDPLNYNVGGRFEGLDEEFIHRIKKTFLPYLEGGSNNPSWRSQEISELWDWAESNWSSNDDEIEIDEIVLFRLIPDVLQAAAEHSDIGSQLEGMGIETEYTLIYDDDSDRVLNRAMEALDTLLIPKK